MGKVVRRPLGGISGWVAEDVYCDLTARLRIPRSAIRDLGALKSTRVSPLFARYYFDGTLAGKIDLGFLLPNSTVAGFLRNRSKRWGLEDAERNAANLRDLLRHIAATGAAIPELPARLSTGEGPAAEQPLLALLRPLLRRLAYASTQRSARPAIDAAMTQLRVGPPVLCIECAGAVAGELTAAAQHRNAAGQVAASSVALTYAPHGSDEWPCWILFAQDGPGGHYQKRLQRIALLRLSTDLWGLRQLITLLGRDRLEVEPRSAEAQILQEYVRQVCRRLRSDLKAMHQTEAAQVAQPTFRNLFQPGAVEAAFSRLATLDARPNVRTLLKDTVAELVDRGEQRNVSLGPGAVYVEGTVAQSVTTNVNSELQLARR